MGRITRRRAFSGTRPKARDEAASTRPPPPGPYPPPEAAISIPRLSEFQLGPGFRPPQTTLAGEVEHLGSNQRRTDAARKFEDARRALSSGDYVGAFVLLTEATTLDETCPDYHVALGHCLLLRESANCKAPYGQILRSLNRALSLDESHAGALYLKGRVMRRLGKEDIATEYFRRVLEVDPQHVDAARALRIAKGSRPSRPGDR